MTCAGWLVVAMICLSVFVPLASFELVRRDYGRWWQMVAVDRVPWALQLSHVEKLAKKLHERGFIEVGVRVEYIAILRLPGRVFWDEEWQTWATIQTFFGISFVTLGTLLPGGHVLVTEPIGGEHRGDEALELLSVQGTVMERLEAHRARIAGAMTGSSLRVEPNGGTMDSYLEFCHRHTRLAYGGRHSLCDTEPLVRAPGSLQVDAGLHQVVVNIGRRQWSPFGSILFVLLLSFGPAVIMGGIWSGIIGMAVLFHVAMRARWLPMSMEVVVSTDMLVLKRRFVRALAIQVSGIRAVEMEDGGVRIIEAVGGRDRLHRIRHYGTAAELRWLVRLIEDAMVANASGARLGESEEAPPELRALFDRAARVSNLEP